MEPFEVIEYKGEEIRLYYDEDAESPREWDNVGTMVCWHRRYTLGDEQPSMSAEEWMENLLRENSDKYREASERLDGIEERLSGWHWSKEDKMYLPWQHFTLWLKARAYVQRLRDQATGNLVILPLYLYDHSGITMRTFPFYCPWDSGQVGWIYTTLEKLVEAYGSQDENPTLDSPTRYSFQDGTVRTLREAGEASLHCEVRTYDQYLCGDVYGWETDGDSCSGYFGSDHEQSGLLPDARAAVDNRRMSA